MIPYKITAEMNLKKIIAESREVAQALNEFADNLEKLDDLIKNADNEEDKERFKALKVLANYYHPSQIRSSMDNFADGRYDLTIDLVGCCRKF